jgi:F420-dependent oxidoreductase-like protein
MIRLGLQIPNFTYPGVSDADLFQRVSDMAVTAEASGFDSVWVMDHFYQLPMLGRPDQPMFEAYALLSALAARTTKVRLGAMVGGVTYRNPAFLAKVVTSLDVISSGRAILGIGAAWFEQEHIGYGYDFGTFSDRFEKLEEALQIITSMFRNDTTTFAGQHYRTHEALNLPKPISPNGPPILIGGSGEKKTLRMVAQYADACNVFGQADDVKRLMGVLDEHCERLGRDPKSITRTRLGSVVVGRSMDDAMGKVAEFMSARGITLESLPDDQRAALTGMFMIGGPDEIAEQVAAFTAAGLDGLVVNIPTAHDLDSISLAGELLGAALP